MWDHVVSPVVLCFSAEQSSLGFAIGHQGEERCALESVAVPRTSHIQDYVANGVINNLTHVMYDPQLLFSTLFSNTKTKLSSSHQRSSHVRNANMGIKQNIICDINVIDVNGPIGTHQCTHPLTLMIYIEYSNITTGISLMLPLRIHLAQVDQDSIAALDILLRLFERRHPFSCTYLSSSPHNEAIVTWLFPETYSSYIHIRISVLTFNNDPCTPQVMRQVGPINALSWVASDSYIFLEVSMYMSNVDQRLFHVRRQSILIITFHTSTNLFSSVLHLFRVRFVHPRCVTAKIAKWSYGGAPGKGARQTAVEHRFGAPLFVR